MPDLPDRVPNGAATTPRIGSLCSGYAGLDHAVQAVIGGELTWVADPDPGATAILAHHHPDVPNLGDITTVDWATVPPVDVLAMGFPCQDVSVAGQRAGLLEGNRSGVWRHCARAISELNPELVVIENVPGLLSSPADGDVEPCPWCLGDTGSEPPLRALGAVLADLAALGFDAEWTSLRASEVGACHQRNRVFIVAWPAHAEGAGLEERREGRPARGDGGVVPDTTGVGWGEGRPEPAGQQGRLGVACGGGAVAADTAGERHGDAGTAGVGGLPSAAVAGGASVVADAEDVGFSRGGQHGDGGPDLRTLVASVASDADRELGDQRGDAASGEAPGGGASAVGCGCDRAPWGRYAAAVHRWEQVTGRAAPSPVDERGRLAPAFVEFLMGLAEGHVTAVPNLSRNAQLKALGNGVVPQQAEAALRLLLARAFPAASAA